MSWHPSGCGFRFNWGALTTFISMVFSLGMSQPLLTLTFMVYVPDCVNFILAFDPVGTKGGRGGRGCGHHSQPELGVTDHIKEVAFKELLASNLTNPPPPRQTTAGVPDNAPESTWMLATGRLRTDTVAVSVSVPQVLVIE